MHKHSHHIQKVGVFLTLICAIHCMAMPFVITALPFLGDYISEDLEHIIVVVSLVLATFILLKDYKQHQIIKPFLIFIFGGILQIIAIIFAHNQTETILLVLGGLVITVAYFVNWHLHKKFFHEH